MTPEPQIDAAKQEAFVGRVMGDASAAMVTVLSTIGDRLGLFKDLASHGPATSGELAKRTSINERYAREWLGGMASAGYLEYDPSSRRFTLPAEHVAALAQEEGPFFFGGMFQFFSGLEGTFDKLLDAFRNGGGVRQAAYTSHWWDGMERFTAGWFENMMLQQWFPEMPDVRRKLEQGALAADVGCGRGRASIKLAAAFPKSRFVGYDLFEPSIEKARQLARDAGVEDRVSFRHLDAAQGLPEEYDVVTTFDVMHDAPDPSGVLKMIRKALKPDGFYVCLDINCSDKLEENAGPLGALFHGFSVVY